MPAIRLQPRLRAPRGGLVVGDRQYRGGVFLPDSARPALEAAAMKAAIVAQVDPVEIGIHGFAYRVRPISIAEDLGTVAFELSDTARNRVHHVHRSVQGEVVCDCGDFTFRRSGTSEPCKHGRRLAELGLIASAIPRLLPPFASRETRPRIWAPTPTYRNRFEPTADEAREAAALFA